MPKSRALRVGIGWAGNPNFSTDRTRSIGLPRLLPLLSAPGIQIISLQRDLRAGDEALLRQYPNVIHLGDKLDFNDTAAVMALLDLVISSDTEYRTRPSGRRTRPAGMGPSATLSRLALVARS